MHGPLNVKLTAPREPSVMDM